MAAWRERPHVDAARPEPGDEVLAINAAALPGPWLDHALAAPAPALWRSEERTVGGRVPFRSLEGALGSGAGFEDRLAEACDSAIVVSAEWLDRPWHLVERSGAALVEDLASLRPAQEGRLDPRAALIEPERIRIGPGARVDAYAVLDARGGAIRIDAEAVVGPQTVVVGPCVIGRGTQLLGGTISTSTIGPQCRIAGEVDACLWQGWANKRHHGFVGHSVVGEWVNLGALTTTSDLKNNYGEVRVRIEGREVATGVYKLGSILGAHVKTGIGTLLPTGAVIGAGSNLFGGGRFTPKEVAAFTWWDGETASDHELERMLATARIAMSRREHSLGPEDEAVLRGLFARTAPERARRVLTPSRASS
jgi:UDP-N-acetylglucosamine diphosphorylase/glucosamine-1-phosphate N-acetyltransferase